MAKYNRKRGQDWPMFKIVQCCHKFSPLSTLTESLDQGKNLWKELCSTQMNLILAMNSWP